MTVKDIIKTSALMIGREDVADYLSGTNTTENQYLLTTLKVMVNLFNLVVGELSGTFIPMIKTERVFVENGKIYYKNLLERALEISAVYDLNGNKLEYTQTAEYISVGALEVDVEYEYSPANYDLNDKIGYSEKDVSLATLSYGLCAEYCISLGDFDQAVMWHKRYVDSVKERKKITNYKIKERCFV